MTGITTEIEQGIGFITLSEPRTLNALTYGMIKDLQSALAQFEENNQVLLIVLKSSHPKAFCAGGDVKTIRQHAIDNNLSAINAYFTEEYQLNHAIAECKKPYLSLIDGTAMGGGLGISVHGRYRVVTERSRLAMPEVKIGFFPDVGASYFLPALNYQAGLWLALTGEAVDADDAVSIGLATHLIDSDSINRLLDDLASAVTAFSHEHNVSDNSLACSTSIFSIIDQTLQQYDIRRENKTAVQKLLNRAQWFKDDNIAAIQERLEGECENNPDANGLLEALNAASPYSVKSLLQLFKATQQLDLEQCLRLELNLALEASVHPDFIEGVRAVLVDKDRSPIWQ